MTLEFALIFNSILFGFALAMDAFSVSVANGLADPTMKNRKMFGIAGMFSFFQALMPMIGWICVHTILQYFESFRVLIPWIALILLSYIGSKMIYDTLKGGEEHECEGKNITFKALVVQGIATSIDALSVGLDIAEYDLIEALISALIIAVVTFIVCTAGVFIGKKAGGKLADKAGLLGGGILIFIGLEIFISSWF